MVAPIKIAIVGAGLFARSDHLPALLNLREHFEIVAVCSRSLSSAANLAAAIPHKVDVLSDYRALLARDDLEAVDLVVPIDRLAEMVEQAIAAQKHIISEKPVASDVASGRRLLALPRKTIWMVAETVRYDQSWLRGQELITSGAIGKPILCHMALHISAWGTGYHKTGWRTNNSFPGGYILDGGVHHIAGLRTLMGEIAEVSAFKGLARDDMQPTDSVSAALRFENGCLGAYVITYSAGSSHREMTSVVGDKGAFQVGGQKVDTRGIPGHESDAVQDFKANTVQLELADFAEAILTGTTPKSTPEQAVQDVAVIEAILNSAEYTKFIRPDRIV